MPQEQLGSLRSLWPQLYIEHPTHVDGRILGLRRAKKTCATSFPHLYIRISYGIADDFVVFMVFGNRQLGKNKPDSTEQYRALISRMEHTFYFLNVEGVVGPIHELFSKHSYKIENIHYNHGNYKRKKRRPNKLKLRTYWELKPNYGHLICVMYTWVAEENIHVQELPEWNNLRYQTISKTNSLYTYVEHGNSVFKYRIYFTIHCKTLYADRWHDMSQINVKLDPKVQPMKRSHRTLSWALSAHLQWKETHQKPYPQVCTK